MYLKNIYFIAQKTYLFISSCDHDDIKTVLLSWYHDIDNTITSLIYIYIYIYIYAITPVLSATWSFKFFFLQQIMYFIRCKKKIIMYINVCYFYLLFWIWAKKIKLKYVVLLNFQIYYCVHGLCKLI